MKPLHIGFTWAGAIAAIGTAVTFVLQNQGVISMSKPGATVVAVASGIAAVAAALGHSLATQDR